MKMRLKSLSSQARITSSSCMFSVAKLGICLFAPVVMRMHTHTQTFPHAHTHTCLFAYTRALTHTRAHTHTHTHAHTHTHTQTHARAHTGASEADEHTKAHGGLAWPRGAKLRGHLVRGPGGAAEATAGCVLVSVCKCEVVCV